MKLPYDIIDIEIDKVRQDDVITTSFIIPTEEEHDNGYIDTDEFV